MATVKKSWWDWFYSPNEKPVVDDSVEAARAMVTSTAQERELAVLRQELDNLRANIPNLVKVEVRKLFPPAQPSLYNSSPLNEIFGEYQRRVKWILNHVEENPTAIMRHLANCGLYGRTRHAQENQLPMSSTLVHQYRNLEKYVEFDEQGNPSCKRNPLGEPKCRQYIEAFEALMDENTRAEYVRFVDSGCWL